MTEKTTFCLPEANTPTPSKNSGLKFGPADGFDRELRKRVSQYFKNTGLRERDCPRMYVKSALVLSWLVASYVLLVFGGGPWWVAAPLAASLGLAMAAVGFNIQHDGGHHAYSNRPWVNRLMARSLDLVGGSSYVWARKHNSIHHSFANITGHDDDINLGPLGRLTPHQRRLKVHRLQHYYLWVLYGFLPIKWHAFDDFRDVITGRIAGHRFPRPTGWSLTTMLLGKAGFFFFALVLPAMLHPWWAVLALYGVTMYLLGVTLSVVFQLAHCVEEAEFPMPEAESGRMASGWAAHQVETTVDFARKNRVLSWFVGGLNFQIEHHLFPQICHLHYAALAPIVSETCREFGLKYRAHTSLFSAVASHFRWLRRMGMPVAA